MTEYWPASEFSPPTHTHELFANILLNTILFFRHENLGLDFTILERPPQSWEPQGTTLFTDLWNSLWSGMGRSFGATQEIKVFMWVEMVLPSEPQVAGESSSSWGYPKQQVSFRAKSEAKVFLSTDYLKIMLLKFPIVLQPLSST